MKITIIVEEEVLDYVKKSECPSFEIAHDHLKALERSYHTRVALETKRTSHHD